MKENIERNLIDAAKTYTENLSLRAVVQAIPYVGGPIDTLFAGKGAKIQSERIQHLLREISKRLDEVESVPALDDEKLYDILILALEKAAKERVKEKREIYASIVARHVATDADLDDSEAALRIVSDLEEVHLRILSEALRAPLCDGVFAGLKVLRVAESAGISSLPGGPIFLPDRLPYSYRVVDFACSELVAKGLLYDEGIGRMDAKAIEYVVATDTARWLESWLLAGNV